VFGGELNEKQSEAEITVTIKVLTNFPNVLGAYNSANIFNSIALKLNFTNIMGNALIVCKLQ